MPSGVTIENWYPLGIGTDLLVYQFSPRTWVFAFLLVSLLVAVIFTDTIRLNQGNNLTTWTGSMVLTAVGLFSILSQTLLAVIITWSIIDVVEIGILTKIIDHKKIHYAAVVEFSTRVAGTLMIISVVVISNIHHLTIEASAYSAMSLSLILSGSVLRLGVLPMHVPFTANLPVRRSLGTILRFVAPISVFSFLSQIQPPKTLDIFSTIIFLFALVAALYGAIKWLISQNELIGRPYWMLAFSGLVIITFLRGQIESMIALSMIMIVCGGAVFLHSSSSRYFFIYVIFLVISMAGFPYTPVTSAWVGLLSAPIKALDFILIISLCLLFLGVIRHLLRIQHPDPAIERWMKMFYAIGLILLFIVPWLTLIWRFKDIRSFIFWYGPVLLLIMIASLLIFRKSKIDRKFLELSYVRKAIGHIGFIGKYLEIVFTFDWLFRLLRKIYEILFRIMQFFISTLEGDGGLLWALLFLALLASVIIGDRIP